MNETTTEATVVTSPEIASEVSHAAPIEPVRAITGLIDKPEGSRSALFRTQLGRLWDVTDQIAIDFINEIEKRFRSKNKRFGYFSSPSASLPRELKQYVGSEVKTAEQKFMTFCQGMLAGLGHGADEVNAAPAAGGNLVVMHYTSQEEDDLGKILIVLLEKKNMFDFDRNMLPERLEPIDTKSIKQAAMIDLNLFEVSFPANDGEAYLRFIEGSSKAAFFKKSLGCSEDIDNERSVQELNKALAKFIEFNNINIDLAEELRSGVKALLIEHSKPNSEPLSLQRVQGRIDQILPEGNVAKGSFSTFSNDQEFQVSEWFSPTHSQANKVGKIVLNDENKSYDVEVSENSIGEMGSSKPVKLSENGEYLCFPISAEKRRVIYRLTGRPLSDDDETA